MSQRTADPESESIKRVLGVPLPHVIAGGSILSFLVFWELMARIAYDELVFVFPSLIEIFTELFGLFSSSEFYYHLWISTQEIFTAFALAAVIGIGLGSIIGSNRFLADSFEPVIYYFSTVPKIILYPMFIAALGAASLDSKIAVGFFSAIFPILVNTIAGALGVRADLVKVAKVNRASLWEVFSKVYVPSMITNIVNGLRLGIGVAIIGTLFAELFVSQAGLGNRIAFYFANLFTSRMYAVLIFIFGVSLGLNFLLLGIQKFLRSRGYGGGGSEGTFGF